MNINQGIVIVNEFTIRGSRGNSPGNYVLEYMARDRASENLTPTMVRSEHVKKMEKHINETFKREATNQTGQNMSDFVVRYMARDTATEMVMLEGETSIDSLRKEFEDIQGLSGVAFSPTNLSMSHDEVKEKSKLIQSEYEKGKPVLKTVISFDTDYLKEKGVIPKDVEVKKKGDLYGKADQAKLRLAIQHGLKNIRSEYSDLDWIGVIQVDTMHLHCHLAMVDKGPGKRFTKDGDQKGMLNSQMKLSIQRGIDNTLSECQLVKPLSIQMESERRNTISFIKRFTYKIMEERGLPQYLLACLPKDDKSLWKASINTDGGKDNVMTIQKGKSKKQIQGNMKKANEIVRAYVVDLLNRPDSGFADAMRIKHDYLIAQRNRGDFDNYQTYKTKGTGKNRKSVLVRLSPDAAVRDKEEEFREEVIKKGMNAVYDVLKNIDDRTITLHTPLLDAMSMPYEEMANYVKEDKLIEFGFRLRSYSSRLDYHKKSYKKVNEIIHQYEDGDQITYNPESKVVYDFLKIEQEYNHALMCKYQTFLHFYHVNDEYQEDYDHLMYLRHRSYNRYMMKEDKSLMKSNDVEKTEKKGQDIYGLPGASLLITNPILFQQQMDREDKEYQIGLRNFKEKLAEMGLLYDADKDEVTQGLEYNFDDVKAYDLHHMSYDFTYDFKIASENVNRFVEMSNRRYEAYQKAQIYLEKTGQQDALSSIVNADDIKIAKELADEFRGSDNMYHTKYDNSDLIKRNTATIRLDNEIYEELSDRNMMKSLQDIMREMDMQQNSGDEFETTRSGKRI